MNALACPGFYPLKTRRFRRPDPNFLAFLIGLVFGFGLSTIIYLRIVAG